MSHRKYTRMVLGGVMRGNMKAERARAGLSAEEVAKQIGVNRNSVFRWESGEAEPTAENLEKLVQLYGCTIEYLLEQTTDRTAKAIAGK